jgi:hypothetical protein
LTDCDVLIVAPMDDLHARAVITEVKRKGGTVALASFRHLTKGDSLSIYGNHERRATLRVGDTNLDLSRARSIWWRRPENPVRRPDGTSESWFRRREWESLVLSLEGACACKWVNRPSRQWGANRKLFQMARADEFGLRTPATLVTNDPRQVREFRRSFPRTIYKSMGETSHQNTGTRFLDPDADERLDRILPNCPVIFQEFIDARHDVRVTVVGERLFAVRIDSQDGDSTLDWRFDHSVGFELFSLPPEIERRVFRLMRGLGLIYGALDLRVTPDGEYVFLEVNPSGQYLFAELLTGARITEALADELLAGH